MSPIESISQISLNSSSFVKTWFGFSARKVKRSNSFVVNGFSLTPNMDASGIKGALGEPLSYFEEPSCASQGTDKYYTYPGYMIQTYDDGEKEVINYITFKDDSVSTKEGIDLSMTKENVIEAYGEDYYETANSISYESGDTKLKFIFEDDLIIAIEYSVK